MSWLTPSCGRTDSSHSPALVGSAKRRLALQVAAQLLPEAHDGVWLCELAVADAEEAAVEILTRALGVVPRAGMSAPRKHPRSPLRERDCLIVLDNCEHLLDVVAGLTDAVLLGCQLRPRPGNQS